VPETKTWVRRATRGTRRGARSKLSQAKLFGAPGLVFWLDQITITAEYQEQPLRVLLRERASATLQQRPAPWRCAGVCLVAIVQTMYFFFPPFRLRRCDGPAVPHISVPVVSRMTVTQMIDISVLP